MKTKLMMIVATGLLMAADDSPADKAKKELEALQGTWNGVSAQENGQAVPEANAKSMQLIIKGDKYTFKLEGREFEQGTLKVDPTKKPKTIDIKITMGDDKGKDQPGYYELEKDTLKICVPSPGKPRPKEFGAKPDSGANLFVFQRPKDVG